MHERSNSWLGFKGPVFEIKASGLWNRQDLDGQPLSDNEFERIKWLGRFSKHGNEMLSGTKNPVQRPTSHAIL
jgi:hypothetical protein